MLLSGLAILNHSDAYLSGSRLGIRGYPVNGMRREFVYTMSYLLV